MCVLWSLCPPPPPTLVLKSIPNNRLGIFPEIWIHLIARPLVLDSICPLWFSIKSTSWYPVINDTRAVVLKHPKQPVARSAETEVKMMSGGSHGGSRRHGSTVLQPRQMITGWLGCDQEWETNDQRFSKRCAHGSQKIKITGREVARKWKRDWCPAVLKKWSPPSIKHLRISRGSE